MSRAGVAAALETMLDGLELDEAGQLQAAIARALAIRLDSVVESASGPTQTTAGMAQELRAVIDAILTPTDPVDQAFVARLLTEVDGLTAPDAAMPVVSPRRGWTRWQ